MAVLLAVAVQTGGVLVWAGAAAQRIEVLEERVAIARPVGERLARVWGGVGGGTGTVGSD